MEQEEITKIWIQAFSYKDNANVSNLGVSEKILTFYKGFNIKSIPFESSRDFEKMSLEHQKCFLMEKYNFNEDIDFASYFYLITEIYKIQGDEKITNFVEIISPYILRFFILFSYKITEAVKNYPLNDDNLYYITIIHNIMEVFFNNRPSNFRQFIILLGDLLINLSSSFNLLKEKDFLEQAPWGLLYIATNIIIFIQMSAEKLDYFSFLIDFVIKMVYSCSVNKLGGPIHQTLYSQFISFSCDDNSFTMYDKDQNVIILEIVKSLIGNNRESLFADNSSLFHSMCQLLTKYTPQNVESKILYETIDKMIEFIDFLLSKNYEGVNKKEIHKFEFPKVPTYDPAYNNAHYDKKLLDIDAAMTEQPKTYEKVKIHEKLKFLDISLGCLFRTSRETFKMIIESIAEKESLTLVVFIIHGFNSASVNEEQILTKTNFLAEITKPIFLNDSLFEGESIKIKENYLYELEVLIQKCFKKSITVLSLLNTIKDIISRKQPKVIAFIAQIMTMEIIKDFNKCNYYKDKEFLDILFNVDSTFKRYLIKEGCDPEIEKKLIYTRSHIIKFLKYLIPCKINKTIVFCYRNKLDYLFSLLFEDETREDVLDMIRTAAVEVSTPFGILDKTSNFLSLLSVELNDPKIANLFTKLIQIINLAVQNNQATEEFMRSIKTSKIDMIFSKIPSTYSSTENYKEEVHYKILMLIISFYHITAKKFPYLSEYYNTPPFAIFRNLSEDLEKVKITQEAIDELLSYIYDDSNGDDIQIYNCGPLFFLMRWLRGSPLLESACKTLSTCINSSIPNRYQCFKAEVLPVLITEFGQSNEDLPWCSNCMSLIGLSFFQKNELFTAIRAISKCYDNSTLLLRLLNSMLGDNDENPSSFFHIYPKDSSMFHVADIPVKDQIKIKTKLFLYSKRSNYTIMKIKLDKITIEVKVSGSEFIINVDKEGSHTVTEKMSINDNNEIFVRNEIFIKPTSIIFSYGTDTVKIKPPRWQKFLTTGMLDIQMTCCDFKGMTISLGEKDPVKIASFKAALVNNKKVFNTINSEHYATLDGIAISVASKLISAIQSCGGPSILLPLFLEAEKHSKPTSYISSLFTLLSSLLSKQEKIHGGNDFFSILSVIFKSIDEKFLDDNIWMQFSTIFRAINQDYAKSMTKNFALDFNLTKRIPNFVPMFYRNNTEFLSNLDTFHSLFKRIIYAYSNYELDEDEKKEEEKEKKLLNLIRLVVDKKLDMNNKKDLLSIFLMGYYIQKAFLSRVSLQLAIEIQVNYKNTYSKLLQPYRHFPPISRILRSSDTVIKLLAIKFMAMLNNQIETDDVVAELFKIAAASEISISSEEDADRVASFILVVMTTRTIESFDINSKVDFTTPMLIIHQQFLPFICNIIGELSEGMRKNILEFLYISITTYGIGKISNIYYLCILYIMHVTKEYTKWGVALCPKGYTFSDYSEIFAFVNIFAAIEGIDISLLYNIILKEIMKLTIAPYNIASIMYNVMHRATFRYNKKEEFNTFHDFLRRIKKFFNGPAYLKIETINSSTFSEEWVETIFNLIALISDNNYKVLSSEPSWFLLADLLISVYQFDMFKTRNEFAKFSEYVTNLSQKEAESMKGVTKHLCKMLESTPFKGLSQSILYLVWTDINDIDEIGEVDTVDEIEAFGCKAAMSLTNSIDVILNQTSVIEQIALFLTPEQEKFDIEYTEIISELFDKRELEREEKHKMALWEDLKCTLENSIGGIWAEKSTHRKMDQTIDSYGRHYRLKVNRHFDDHKVKSKKDISGKREEKEAKFEDGFNQKREVSSSDKSFDAKMLTIKNLYIGKIYITKEVISFEAFEIDKHMSSRGMHKSAKFIEIETNAICHILWRKYKLIDCACEIFIKNYDSFFFILENNKERNNFIKYISRNTDLHSIKIIQQKPMIEMLPVLGLTKAWQERRISNYQYLYWLNMYAGRSYKDISQYPVFPWIISNYSQTSLDLSNRSQFRDLSKPIGAMDAKRLNDLLQKMDSVKDDPRLNCIYRGGHYSSPGLIINFLMRCEPFTTLQFELQTGKFDVADRLFNSIQEMWSMATSAPDDYIELIPEFFSFRYFLVNFENFDLGVLQNGKRVNDVELPPWAKNASHFILMNRLALESPIATEGLPSWIDLIFGCKSRGKESFEAYNAFAPTSYSENIEGLSEEELMFYQESASCFGTSCDQLFKEQHPQQTPIIFAPLSSTSANITTEAHPLYLHVEKQQKNTPIQFFSVMKMISFNSTIYIACTNGTLNRVKFVKQKDSKQITVTTDKFPVTFSSAKHFLIFPQSSLILVGAPFKNEFSIYDMADKKVIKSISTKTSAVSCISGEDTRSIVSCYNDSSVTIWSDVIRNDSKFISAHLEAVVESQSSIALDAVVTVDKSGVLIVSSFVTGKPYATVTLDVAPTQVLLTPMGLIVLVFSGIGLKKEGLIEVRDLTCNLIHRIGFEQSATTACIAKFPDFVEYVVACFDKDLLTIRLTDMKTVCVVNLPFPAAAMTFNEDEMSLFVSERNGDLIQCKYNIF